MARSRSLSPEALYQRLGQTIATMPDFPVGAELLALDMQWLGTAYALASKALEFNDQLSLSRAIAELRNINIPTRHGSAVSIALLMHRALAIAELDAPAAAQGAFIPAGNAFDAMAAVGKVLQGAGNNVLLVDPYMDEKVLADFAVLAPETIKVRLLADRAGHKPSFEPAVIRWQAQYGTTRPAEARLAPPRTLHDRLIAVDSGEVWLLTQSFNGLAARSPATIVRVDPETAALKIAAYEAMWQSAVPV